MPRYYLDCETNGIDRRISKIITIQVQEIDEYTGKAIGDLQIFKEWESSETEILRRFLDYTELDPFSSPFQFVPTGFNLKFDLQFLMARLRFHSMPVIDFLDRPHIDLHPIGVLMNNGQFKGSGLDKLTGKPHDGKIIPFWYEEKNWERIEEYIQKETVEFMKFLQYCQQALPDLLYKFKTNGVDVSAFV